MFRPKGAFIRTLDANNRIAIPPDLLRAYPRDFVLAPGFDNSMRLYAPKQWERFATKLAKLEPDDPDDADLIRFFASMTSEGSLDKSNRLHITQVLMEWTGVEDEKRDFQLHDAGDFIEAWEVSRFKGYMAERTPVLKDLARRKFGKGGGTAEAGDGASSSADPG